MGQLTKQHGCELRPAGEPFGVALALMPVHQSGELVARDFVKQLTEETAVCTMRLPSALRGMN